MDHSPITDDLNPANVTPRLSNIQLGHPYLFESEIDSTNTHLMQLAQFGATTGTVVVADSQTQGRGRLHRIWNSPPGVNLYLSVLLRPTWDVQAAPPLSLAAGVALAEAVEEWLVEPPTLKWPNDVLVQGKKIAGILVEASIVERRLNHVVLGIGLNVNQTEFPTELADIASSLLIATATEFDRGEVLSRILHRLAFWLDALENEPETIIARWEQFAPWLGQQVRVVHSDRAIKGTTLGLADDGALRVQDSTGIVHNVLAGDAYLRG